VNVATVFIRKSCKTENAYGLGAVCNRLVLFCLILLPFGVTTLLHWELARHAPQLSDSNTSKPTLGQESVWISEYSRSLGGFDDIFPVQSVLTAQLTDEIDRRLGSKS
jgi:hypothetical protein